MTEFTSICNGKEIIFTDKGIRYDNRVFINYDDMSDITFRTGAESAIIFRYKGHLVKMPINGDDRETIETYIAPTPEPEPEPEPVNVDTSLEKFSYLDPEKTAAPEQEPPKEEEEKPKKKTGLIIGALVLVAVLVVGLIIIL